MKIMAIPVSWLVSVLLVLVTLIIGANGSASVRNDNSSPKHSSGLMAKVTFADGTTQNVRVDGVGCTESLCSTVLMKARTETNATVEVWLDSIAAIRDIRQDAAVFVAKDGSERRLTFVSDFRVFYVSSNGGAKRKIDLAKIKSIEFPAGGH